MNVRDLTGFAVAGLPEATSLDALVMSISESSRPCQLPMSTIGIVLTKY